MTRPRLRLVAGVLLALAVLAITAACGGDGNDTENENGSGSDSGAGTSTATDEEAPFFVPPQPLTAGEFALLIIRYGAKPLAPGETPTERLDVEPAVVERYQDELCRGGNPILPARSIGNYHDHLPAYAAIFDGVAQHCMATSAALDRERGDVAWSVAHNELALERLLHPPQDAASRFCKALDDTSEITPGVIANLASESGLVRSSTATKAIEIGVSILIKACPQLIGDTA